jgi:pyrroloquinoline quinone biosynthesis protein B
VYVPGCGEVDAAVRDRLGAADAVFFDGTFWSDDELITIGVGTRTARQLDHVPISGRAGSLELLSGLPCRHRIYTHINNTNPILLESSPERAAVTGSGIRVGDDGDEVVL